MLGWDTVLKLAAVGVCIMVALQVIFSLVFQIIGYSSFRLSVALIASALVFIAVLVAKEAHSARANLRENQQKN